MPRPPNVTPLPPHPAIGAQPELRATYGQSRVAFRVTCPACDGIRWYPRAYLAQALRRGTFTGKCLTCSSEAARAEAFASARARGKGRRIDGNGYVQIYATHVDPADLPLFRAMQGKASFVLEHRLVMARTLGRPLTSRECVDHMDGVKTHNDPTNLRLYRKGRQEPGSAYGYGTFYHEWQLADARAERLARQLRDMGIRPAE